LSGDFDFDGDVSEDVYHVVTASGTDASAVLDGFTILHGNANGAAASPCQAQCGGGIYILNGSPTLANLRIGTQAVHGGGLLSRGQPSPE